MRTETIASVKFLSARNSVRETVFSYLKLETETENTELNYYSRFFIVLFFSIVTESLKTTSNPPEVTVTLLRNEDLPGKSVPLDKRQLPIDILLLTVKDWEFLACISCFNRDFRRSYCKELRQDVYLGTGETGNDDMMLKIAVVKCYTGSTVPQGSCVVVMKAVEVLRPKAVFSVGCCGVLDLAKVKLGDVVVSVKLISYSSSKVTDEGITERGVRVPLKANISKLMLSAAHGWKAPLKNPKEFEVEMHQGVFLSGPESVDSSARREALNQRFSEADVIEMEGEGKLNKFQLPQ